MSRWTGPLYWPISLYGDDGWGLRVEFVEPDADGVEQPIDALAHKQLAARLVLGACLGFATFFDIGQCFAQLVDQPGVGGGVALELVAAHVDV